jgi:hypothetical protein
MSILCYRNNLENSPVPQDRLDVSIRGAVIVGIGVAELAAAMMVHDHVVYPAQMTKDHTIDTEVANLDHNEPELRQEVVTLARAETVIKKHDKTVPQTVADILSTDRAGIRHDQLQTATLQQERPSMPVTSNELFSVFLIPTIGVAMAVRRIRRSRRAKLAATWQTDTTADPDS